LNEPEKEEKEGELELRSFQLYLLPQIFEHHVDTQLEILATSSLSISIQKAC